MENEDKIDLYIKLELDDIKYVFEKKHKLKNPNGLNFLLRFFLNKFFIFKNLKHRTIDLQELKSFFEKVIELQNPNDLDFILFYLKLVFSNFLYKCDKLSKITIINIDGTIEIKNSNDNSSKKIVTISFI